jgi:hypothetical protein
MRAKKRILILCTGNSARSQIAEGLMRQDAGERFEAFSAGTKPGQVRSEAVTRSKNFYEPVLARFLVSVKGVMPVLDLYGKMTYIVVVNLE